MSFPAFKRDGFDGLKLLEIVEIEGRKVEIPPIGISPTPGL
jgi:hypothetical protein